MLTHPDIEHARLTAGAYCVRPSARGFYVWRFRPWSHRNGGWRIMVEARTREHAWLHVLSQLGLMKEAPPAPLEAVQPVVTWSDAEWL